MSALAVFGFVLLGLIGLVLVFNLVTRMKNVPPSVLAVVHGKPAEERGFSTFRGGRVFVFPLIHRFTTMNLTPQTVTVVVESAIARGIVPLVVKATVSFAISTTPRGMFNAVRRILFMTEQWEYLGHITQSIIEGHLRDSIASMTPEQVMSQKDRLVKNMIRICKEDLESIGLEITSMNIADVDDHRMEGVTEPDLYIGLLKRIQAAHAQTQSRKAKATAMAESQDAEQARRAEVRLRQVENELEQVKADAALKIEREKQRSREIVAKARKDAEAKIVGLQGQLKAEQQRIQLLEAKARTEVLTPAQAEARRRVIQAEKESATLLGRAGAELSQLEQTIQLLGSSGKAGAEAFLIDRFGEMVRDFARTLEYFEVAHTAVISGEPTRGPLSAVEASSLDRTRDALVGEAVSAMRSTLAAAPPLAPGAALTTPAAPQGVRAR